MKLRETVSVIDREILRLSRIFNNFGLILMMLAILLTVSSVIGRRVFNYPIRGTHELESWAVFLVAFFTWAACQARRGHITITFITDLLPPKVVTFFDVILHSVSVFVYALVVWQIFVFAASMKREGAISSELRLPEWPIQILAAVALALFVVVLIRTIAQSIAQLGRRK